MEVVHDQPVKDVDRGKPLPEESSTLMSAYGRLMCQLSSTISSQVVSTEEIVTRRLTKTYDRKFVNNFLPLISFLTAWSFLSFLAYARKGNGKVEEFLIGPKDVTNQ